jgi:uncharacterized protein YxjI
MDSRFSYQSYLISRKFLQLVGATFRIYEPSGGQVFYSKMKAFKLREDIRLYDSDAMTTELLTITTQQIIDFSAIYDVVDAATHEKVGALRRKGLKSMLRDEWIIFNTNSQEIGLIQEDSMLFALIRRFLTNLIPQKYHISVQGQTVGAMKQNFNPFTMKINLDLSQNSSGLLDPRLAIAAAVLLCAIEQKQQ